MNSSFIGKGKINKIDDNKIHVVLDSGPEVTVRIKSEKIEIDDVVDVYKTKENNFFIKLSNPYTNTIHASLRHPYIAIGDKDEEPVKIVNSGNDRETIGQKFGMGASISADIEKTYVGYSLNNYQSISNNGTVNKYNMYTYIKGPIIEVAHKDVYFMIKTIKTKPDESLVLEDIDDIKKLDEYDDFNDVISLYATGVIRSKIIYEIFGCGDKCLSKFISINYNIYEDILGSDTKDYDSDYYEIIKFLDLEGYTLDQVIEFKIRLQCISCGDTHHTPNVLQFGPTSYKNKISSITIAGSEYNVSAIELFMDNGTVYNISDKIKIAGENVELISKNVSLKYDNIELPTIFSINKISDNDNITISNRELNLTLNKLTTNLKTYHMSATDEIKLYTQAGGFIVDQYGTSSF